MEDGVFCKTAAVPQTRGLMLQLGDLFHMLEEASTAHVQKLGLGGQFEKESLAWVLNRMKLEILSMPQPGSAIEIRTWPNEQSHGLYPRQYQICSPDGELLVQAVSIWTLMDRVSRKMAHHSELASRLRWKEESDMPLPKSIKPVQTTLQTIRQAKPEEMDQNGHINNANYVRWLQPLLPAQYEKTHRLTAFQINYIAELYPEDPVCLGYTLDDAQLLVEGSSRDKRSFATAAQFVKR